MLTVLYVPPYFLLNNESFLGMMLRSIYLQVKSVEQEFDAEEAEAAALQ